ncbi:hypothetical protein TNCV_3583511 [Trichonephila clavipes]|nr:hypothetical protein TNCV_3583511 [Trichonephila clavipes]
MYLKHGGGNAMVWGSVAHNGALIDNQIKALAYINVFRRNLLDSAKKLSMENTLIFQQDCWRMRANVMRTNANILNCRAVPADENFLWNKIDEKISL